jgi:hypothetical protein
MGWSTHSGRPLVLDQPLRTELADRPATRHSAVPQHDHIVGDLVDLVEPAADVDHAVTARGRS